MRRAAENAKPSLTARPKSCRRTDPAIATLC